MKKLFLFFLMAIPCLGNGQSFGIAPAAIAPRIYWSESNWYNAFVHYVNDETGTTGDYHLQVQIEDGRVISICLGEDKYVHSGINSYGYTYEGGWLKKVEDEYGNPVTMAIIKVNDEYGLNTLQLPHKKDEVRYN